MAHLIDTAYGGNVNAASAEIGVPQRTLARLYAGEVEKPRGKVPRAIARHFGVDEAWLLEGRGEAPAIAGSPERVRLRLLLDRLDLPSDVRLAYEDLANAPGRALLTFLSEADSRRLSRSSEDMLGESYELAARAWRLVLDGLVRSHGYSVVAKFLVDYADDLRGGFTDFGGWLAAWDRPRHLPRRYDEERLALPGQRGTPDDAAFESVGATEKLAAELREPEPPTPERLQRRRKLGG